VFQSHLALDIDDVEAEEWDGGCEAEVDRAGGAAALVVWCVEHAVAVDVAVVLGDDERGADGDGCVRDRHVAAGPRRALQIRVGG